MCFKVFAMQAEALLKLNKHEEADSIISNAPKFNSAASIKFLGSAVNAYVHSIRALVDAAAGRLVSMVDA